MDGTGSIAWHTTPADTSAPTQTAAPDVAELIGALAQMRYHALQLAADLSRPPKLLRVQAGEFVVEVEWGPPATAEPRTSVGPMGGFEALPTQQDTEQPAASTLYLCANTIGVFYRTPAPDARPFVEEGDIVSVGQQVALIEVMKLMIPVEADQAGRIISVCKENGSPVEYGEKLFVLSPVDA